MRSIKVTSLVVVALLFAAQDAAAQAVETFNTQVTVVDGTTLGTCNQIVARLGGAGAATVGGGVAQLAYPADADGAFFASAQPLPTAPYTARVAFQSIDAPLPSGGDNYLVLAGVYDFAPVVGATAAWRNHGLIEIALSVETGFSGVYISYWGANDVPATWSGTSWHTGLANFVYAFTFTPNTPYQFTLQRSATGYKVLVHSGSTLITETTEFPLNGPRPAPNGAYFATGDVLSDLGRGSVLIDELELPGCALAVDAGVLDSATTADAGASDAGSTSDTGTSVADTGPAADTAAVDAGVVDAGTIDAARADAVDPQGDGAASDGAKADGASFDGSVSLDAAGAPDSKISLGDGGKVGDLGGDGKEEEKSGCDCATTGAPPMGGSLLLGLLFGLALLRRRRSAGTR